MKPRITRYLVTRLALAMVVVITAVFSDLATAQSKITPEQQAELLQLQGMMRQAGAHYSKRDLKESAALVAKVQAKLEEISAGDDLNLIQAAAPIHASLQRAHQLLRARGIKTLLPIKPLKQMKKPDAPKTAPMPPPANGPILFSPHVAPILISKCGRCHVNNARGMVSMANYASLMKGPDAGAVVLPGNAEGSRIIEVIEEGDMPRGGLKVTPAEVSVLKRWITQGAKFDGDDPEVNLKTLAPNTSPSELVKVEPKRATGKESVRFSIDIAPVFIEKCLGCHGGGDRPSARFDMADFSKLMRGGENGPAIMPGKPAESLLIKKLEGTGGGDRMPRNQKPLKPEVIAKIKTWIKEGARIDEGSFVLDIRQVVAVATAKRQSAQEVSQGRETLAANHWKLSLPGVAHDRHSSKNFLVLGTLDEEVLTGIAREAETWLSRIQSLLRKNRSDPVVKGRITLFAISRRYDYGEFGTMVEKRDVPSSEKSTGLYTVVDAYIAMHISKASVEEKGKLDAALVQPLAEVCVAAAGDSPHWYRVGVARAITAKLVKSDPQVKEWNSRAPQVLATVKNAKEIMQGTLPGDDSNVASFAVGSYLLKDTRRFQRLREMLIDNQSFDEAFEAVYGSSPETWLDAMLGKGKKK